MIRHTVRRIRERDPDGVVVIDRGDPLTGRSADGIIASGAQPITGAALAATRGPVVTPVVEARLVIESQLDRRNPDGTGVGWVTSNGGSDPAPMLGGRTNQGWRPLRLDVDQLDTGAQLGPSVAELSVGGELTVAAESARRRNGYPRRHTGIGQGVSVINPEASTTNPWTARNGTYSRAASSPLPTLGLPGTSSAHRVVSTDPMQAIFVTPWSVNRYRVTAGRPFTAAGWVFSDRDITVAAFADWQDAGDPTGTVRVSTVASSFVDVPANVPTRVVVRMTTDDYQPSHLAPEVWESGAYDPARIRLNVAIVRRPSGSTASLTAFARGWHLYAGTVDRGDTAGLAIRTTSMYHDLLVDSDAQRMELNRFDLHGVQGEPFVTSATVTRPAQWGTGVGTFGHATAMTPRMTVRLRDTYRRREPVGTTPSRREATVHVEETTSGGSATLIAIEALRELDLTDRVIEATVDRAVDADPADATVPIGNYAATTATVSLDNSDGALSPARVPQLARPCTLELAAGLAYTNLHLDPEGLLGPALGSPPAAGLPPWLVRRRSVIYGWDGTPGLSGSYRIADGVTTQNPVTNPSFEVSTSGWAWGGTAGTTLLELTRAQDGPIAGQWHARSSLAGRNTGSPYFLCGYLPAAGGMSYTMSMWVRSSRHMIVQPRLWQYVSEGVGTPGGSVLGDPVYLAAGSWQRITMTTVVDSSATLVRLSLSIPPGEISGRLNVVTIPQATSSSSTTTAWLFSTGTGGAVTQTVVTGASDGPRPDVTTYRRAVYTAPATGGSAGPYAQQVEGVAGVAGDVAAMGLWVRSSRTVTGIVYHRFYNVSTVAGATSEVVTLQAGQWTRLDGVVTATGAYDRVRSWFVPNNTAADNPKTGDVYEWTGFLVELGSTQVGSYFDGATAGAVWTGAANASTSAIPHVIDVDAAMLTLGSGSDYFDGSFTSRPDTGDPVPLEPVRVDRDGFAPPAERMLRAPVGASVTLTGQPVDVYGTTTIGAWVLATPGSWVLESAVGTQLPAVKAFTGTGRWQWVEVDVDWPLQQPSATIRPVSDAAKDGSVWIAGPLVETFTSTFVPAEPIEVVEATPLGRFRTATWPATSGGEAVTITAHDVLASQGAGDFGGEVLQGVTIGAAMRQVLRSAFDLGDDQVVVAPNTASLPYILPAETAQQQVADLAKAGALTAYTDHASRVVATIREQAEATVSAEYREDNALVQASMPAPADVVRNDVTVVLHPVNRVLGADLAVIGADSALERGARFALTGVETYVPPGQTVAVTVDYDADGGVGAALAAVELFADYTVNMVDATNLADDPAAVMSPPVPNRIGTTLRGDLYGLTIEPHATYAVVRVTAKIGPGSGGAGGNGVGLYLRRAVVRGQALLVGDERQRFTRAESVAIYGRKPVDVDVRLGSSAAGIAARVGKDVLDNYSLADTTGERWLPDLEVTTIGDPWRELGDRVLAREPHLGVGGEYRVVSHTFTVGIGLSSELYLRRAATGESYLVLDRDRLDDGRVLSY